MIIVIRFELKKIFAKPSNKIALIIFFVAVLVVSYFTISSIEYVDASGDIHTGIAAYNKLKEVKHEWKGNITNSVLQKVLEENNVINNSEEYLSKNVTENNIAYSRQQGFSDIKDMINKSFCDFQEYDYYRVNTVTPSEVGNFYSNRTKHLKEWLSSDDVKERYTKQEKEYLVAKYEEMQTPLYYEYAGAWTSLLYYLPTLIMLITLVGVFLISGIFSDEFRFKSDSVFFSTMYGRNRAIRSKIISGVICITAIYWISISCFSGIVFGSLGVDGANCFIQTSSDGWKCFYYITFLQEFVLTIVGGYIGILFLLILSMLVSAKMRSSVFAVVVPFVMLLIPSFVADFSVLSKILGVLPDQLLQISSSINNFNLYQIGDKVIGAIPILFIVYLTGCFILLPLLYRVYKKSELKS